MRAMAYLLVTRIKNRFIAMVKNPGSLIGMLIMVALLGFVIFAGGQGEADVAYLRPIEELNALMLVLFIWIFILTAKNGLGKGTTLFSMPDVNLLFTSPISSRRILFYGLLQQLGTSLLMGFFLLFQYAWMHNAYGVSVGFVFALVLGYALTVFCAQLTAMVLYVFTAGNEKRKKVMMWVMVAITGAAAAYVLLAMLRQPDNLIGAAVTAATGLPLSLFPVAGWARELVVAISGGAWGMAAWMAAAVAAYIALLAYFITSSRADYYEDVLQATERSFTAVLAAKEGKGAEKLPSNVKVGKTGIGKGWGASAIFYKHMLESRRARRFVLDPLSLIMLTVTIVFAYFIRDAGVLPILAFSVYMQFFTVSTGRWVRELLYPYVYMIPDSAFRKLLWCLGETAYKQAVEAVLLSVALLFILGLTPLEALAFFIARLSFGLLFVAGTILVERLFTGLTVKWLVLIVLILTMIIMMIPGIALAIFVSIRFPDFLNETLRMLLLPAIGNIPVGLLAIFASRNVLRTAELNQP